MVICTHPRSSLISWIPGVSKYARAKIQGHSCQHPENPERLTKEELEKHLEKIYACIKMHQQALNECDKLYYKGDMRSSIRLIAKEQINSEITKDQMMVRLINSSIY